MSYNRLFEAEVLEFVEQTFIFLLAEIGRLCTSYCRSSKAEVKETVKFNAGSRCVHSNSRARLQVTH